jgi:predicted ferric reductase
MESHIIKIKSIDKVTHDVLSIVTDKPTDFSFIPGQATQIAINKSEWLDEERPFTFTNLPLLTRWNLPLKLIPNKRVSLMSCCT